MQGLRDYLWKQRSRFGTQEQMLAYIQERTGVEIKQPTLSCWLLGTRYPGPIFRKAIRDAFGVPMRNWKSMLSFDMVAEEEESLPAFDVRKVS